MCVCAVNIKCSSRLAHTQPCMCVCVCVALWLCGNRALHMHRHAHQHHKTESGCLDCWSLASVRAAHSFPVCTENCRVQTICRHEFVTCNSHMHESDKEIWSDHNRYQPSASNQTHIGCGNSGNLFCRPSTLLTDKLEICHANATAATCSYLDQSHIPLYCVFFLSSSFSSSLECIDLYRRVKCCALTPTHSS